MVFRRFGVLLAARLAVVGLLLAVLVWLLLQGGYYSATVIVLALLAAGVAETWRFVSRTNRELSRFLDAVRFEDYSQRFDFRRSGAGFDALGRTFTAIIDGLRAGRAAQETELRRLHALIEHIPVPLITVHADDAITLQNNAARRLFGTARVTRVADLAQFGADFAASVDEAVPGGRRLVTFRVEEADYQLALASTEIIVGARRERLVSLQDVQSELDATQSEAWHDLVRVLTHEIMNSITPVTSLARSAAELVDDVVAAVEPGTELARDLADVQAATRTVARRSDSLVQFIDSYRQISRLAPAEKKRVPVAEMFDTVCRLAEAEWPGARAALRAGVEPPGLDVYADRDLLEPVLLNLVRNAMQSTAELDAPSVTMQGRLNRRGNVVIEVRDNGPGVPGELARKIFVPFFTTKAGGSGVGLALARQVMNAHGGFIRLAPGDGAGATFTLTF